MRIYTSNMKAMVRGLAAISVITLLAGCASASPSPKQSQEEKQYETAPLTGVQYELGTNPNLALPSVACKIDNLDVARPQVNLNQTDIVFDEMVEGGLTRFVAVWHSTHPTEVGPVRSIRPMDPDIISPLGGIVCYSGGQLKFVNLMRATDVFNASETVEQNNGTFSRAADREAPHNVIVDTAKLAANHTDLAAPGAMFAFGEKGSAEISGVGVTSFKVYFPSALAEWTWSGTQWLRTQDGIKHTDAVTGEQLHATNVVVMEVEIDRQYGYVPKTVMLGFGKVKIFSGGRMIEGEWSKPTSTSPIEFRDSRNNILQLAPGNTWVELQPKAPEGKIKVVLAPAPSATPTN